MKEFALLRPKGANQIDDLTDGLVNTMGYSDATVLYPEFTEVKPDDGVVAEWFYDAYRSNKNSSEIFAIIQYTGQASLYNDVAQLLMGISFTEMKHYDKLGDFITALGGTLRQSFNTSVVPYGKTPLEALELALEGEVSTIKVYRDLVKMITALNKETVTIVIALQLLTKLIADEEFHKKLLEDKIKELKGNG